MRHIPEVGDKITLKEFSFTNKAGGTGLSNWNHNEKYLKPIEVVVTKEWNDYECGQRGWAFPDEEDKELMAYLERNAKTDKKGQYILYWSEFDIVK